MPSTRSMEIIIYPKYKSYSNVEKSSEVVRPKILVTFTQKGKLKIRIIENLLQCQLKWIWSLKALSFTPPPNVRVGGQSITLFLSTFSNATEKEVDRGKVRTTGWLDYVYTIKKVISTPLKNTNIGRTANFVSSQ